MVKRKSPKNDQVVQTLIEFEVVLGRTEYENTRERMYRVLIGSHTTSYDLELNTNNYDLVEFRACIEHKFVLFRGLTNYYQKRVSDALINAQQLT